METKKNQWGATQTAMLLLAAIISLVGTIGILKLFPHFSTDWNTLSNGFTKQFHTIFYILGTQSYGILPDNMTQGVLLIFLAFAPSKSRISAGLLFTIGIMAILYFGINLAYVLTSDFVFVYAYLIYAVPGVILILTAYFSDKFSVIPYKEESILFDPKTGKKKKNYFPYNLFKAASRFCQKQSNVIAGTVTLALLFTFTGKILSFLFYTIYLVIIPFAAYIIIWTLVILGVVFGLYFIIKAFFSGDSGSRTVYVAEKNTGCPFSGRVVTHASTEVLGFIWPASETIFEIDEDGIVSNSKGFQGWIDKNGNIHEGLPDSKIGGGFRQDSTLYGKIIAKISGSHCWVGNNKIGKFIK